LQECGRKLNAYIRRRRRQRMEGERRNIFERYIPDVAEALAKLTDQNEERLLRDLRAISKRRTAQADVELDEDGKPVASGADAASAEEDALAADDATLVVPENEAAPEGNDLFDQADDGNGAEPRKRRRRK
jgi:DNA topoisomerase-6 subunit B